MTESCVRTFGLGKEKENNRHPRRIQNTIHNEILPPNICKSHRCDLGHQKIEHPAHSCGYATHGCALLGWRDLSRIHERQSEEARGVDNVVEIQEKGGSFESSFIIGL